MSAQGYCNRHYCSYLLATGCEDCNAMRREQVAVSVDPYAEPRVVPNCFRCGVPGAPESMDAWTVRDDYGQPRIKGYMCKSCVTRSLPKTVTSKQIDQWLIDFADGKKTYLRTHAKGISIPVADYQLFGTPARKIETLGEYARADAEMTQKLWQAQRLLPEPPPPTEEVEEVEETAELWQHNQDFDHHFLVNRFPEKEAQILETVDGLYHRIFTSLGIPAAKVSSEQLEVTPEQAKELLRRFEEAWPEATKYLEQTRKIKYK